MIENQPIEKSSNSGLPFPLEWLSDKPGKVEEILSNLSIEEQVRLVMQTRGKNLQDLLVLSPRAVEVARALPAEEVYQAITEIGRESALSLLSMVSAAQLQYFFDLEWWQGDKFQPKRALEWLGLLQKSNESQVIEWFFSGEFEQKVVLLQALIKVFKNDEMTDSYEGVHGLEHFSPDGVYEIFFKVKNAVSLKKYLILLRHESESLFNSLMEAVIWYPVTPTVEEAYRWRLTRTGGRGIPEWEEAASIYSHLDPQALREDIPDLDDFAYEGNLNIAPKYPLVGLDPTSFFSQCLTKLEDFRRTDTLSWELVYLANKIMVADRCDPSDLDSRNRAMRKGIGFINIGLDLGAGGNPQKGVKLLERTGIQGLFQVGYHQVIQIRWKAERFIGEHGALLDSLLNGSQKELLGALVQRFPQIGEDREENAGAIQWRNFESMDDIRFCELFLKRWTFYLRFSKMGLGLNPRRAQEYLKACIYPQNPEDVDILAWTLTALARHALFQEISCQPLPEVAAKSFLEIIFVQAIYQDQPRLCDEARVEAFHNALLQLPLAWTSEDRGFLKELIDQSIRTLRSNFGLLDTRGPIDWKYTRGLCIGRESIPD